MEIYKENFNEIISLQFHFFLCKINRKGVSITNSKVTSDKIYADIYQEIADALGEETAVAIYELFKGQQIIFPQKLYRKEYIYQYIAECYTGKNVRELSQKFGYSDRRIRQIVSGMSEKKE